MIETVYNEHVTAETTAKGVWDELTSAFKCYGLMRRVAVCCEHNFT